MKKFFIIAALFALPLIAYLFFASGVHSFARLPILTKEVKALEDFKSAGQTEVTFDDNITVLGFFGENPLRYMGNSFNLAEKIYNDYYQFRDLQFVFIVSVGSEDEVKKFQKEINEIIDPVKWKFVFGSQAEIRELFSSLNTSLELKNDLSTPNVFIIDKEGYLRGRDSDEDEGLLFGYDTGSVAELDDKMTDDVKVILAEYRLELKKYNKDKTSE